MRVSNPNSIFKFDGTGHVLETPVDVLYEVRLLYSAGALKQYHTGMQSWERLAFYTATRIKGAGLHNRGPMPGAALCALHYVCVALVHALVCLCGRHRFAQRCLSCSRIDQPPLGRKARVKMKRCVAVHSRVFVHVCVRAGRIGHPQ